MAVSVGPFLSVHSAATPRYVSQVQRSLAAYSGISDRARVSITGLTSGWNTNNTARLLDLGLSSTIKDLGSSQLLKAMGLNSAISDRARVTVTGLTSAPAFRALHEAVVESLPGNSIVTDPDGALSSTSTLTLAQQRECVGWVAFAIAFALLAQLLLQARLRYDGETTFAFDLLGGSGLYGAQGARKLAQRVFDWMYAYDEDGTSPE